MNSKHKVYINAVSAYSCIGDTDTLMQAVYTAKTGLKTSSIIPNKTVTIGAFNTLDFNAALKKCCEDILGKTELTNYSKTLLLVGSSVGGMPTSEKHFFKDKDYKNIKAKEHCVHSIALYLQEQYGFLATRSYSTACTSSSNALMMAKRLIEVGAYENILVLGADALCKTTIFGFDALGILSSAGCKPFDKERDGMNVAEGVAALLLQNKPCESSVAFLGAAGSSDAYHITNPDPSSTAAIFAMQSALEDASIKAKSIDYINAHGTGTQANDAAEANAVNSLFSHQPYVSSTKGVTGHTLGAAGALEAVICVETIKRQNLPINVGYKNKDANINIVTECKKVTLNYVMSNSFAFGGNNTSLVFGRIS